MSKTSTIKYIDSHCHIHYFSDSIDEKIQNAEQAGCTELLNIIDITDENFDKTMLEMENKNNIYLSIGVHPNSADNMGLETAMEVFSHYQNNKKLMAFGETGIDLYYSKNFIKQIEFFKLHIEACKRWKKILIIHWRNCDINIILDEIPDDTIFIIHCFTGGLEDMKKITNKGGFVSFSGILTFQNTKQDLIDALKEIPLDNLLFETDSPYLTPEPFRGRKNEPKYIAHIYKYASKILDIEEEELCNAVLRNWAFLKHFTGIF